VSWYTTSNHTAVTGAFASNTQYTAELTLTPAAEYSFAGVGAFTYNSLTAQKSFNPGNTITIAITFPVAGSSNGVVTDRDLTNKLPAPVTGEEPVFSIESPQYIGTVEWSNDATPKWRPEHDYFLDTASYSHTASITLIAKAGYTFSGVENLFTYTGYTVIPSSSGDDSVLWLEINFGYDQVVSLFNLSPYFDSPVSGEYPDKAFENEEYIGEIAWEKYGGYWGDNSAFEDGYDYKATVTLHVKRGYTFGDSAYVPDYFYYPGGEIVRSTSNPISPIEITLEISFSLR
jgi:hypothetical protein